MIGTRHCKSQQTYNANISVLKLTIIYLSSQQFHVKCRIKLGKPLVKQNIHLFEAVPHRDGRVSRCKHRCPLFKGCVQVLSNVNRSKNDFLSQFCLCRDGCFHCYMFDTVLIHKGDSDSWIEVIPATWEWWRERLTFPRARQYFVLQNCGFQINLVWKQVMKYVNEIPNQVKWS